VEAATHAVELVSPSWILALAIGTAVKLLGADSMAGSTSDLSSSAAKLSICSSRDNLDAIQSSVVPSPVATSLSFSRTRAST
jgi:hypothetical protein